MKKVAGSIQRKTMLYETGVEYGDYTMNYVLVCAHGCKFPCYAYLHHFTTFISEFPVA